MPTIIADGMSETIENVPLDQLRSILFEKNFSNLPTGVTRQSGATVNWVDFQPPSVGDGRRVIVNPNNVTFLYS